MSQKSVSHPAAKTIIKRAAALSEVIMMGLVEWAVGVWLFLNLHTLACTTSLYIFITRDA